MKNKKSLEDVNFLEVKRLNCTMMLQVRGGGDDNPPDPGTGGTDPLPPNPPK